MDGQFGFSAARSANDRTSTRSQGYQEEGMVVLGLFLVIVSLMKIPRGVVYPLFWLVSLGMDIRILETDVERRQVKGLIMALMENLTCMTKLAQWQQFSCCACGLCFFLWFCVCDLMVQQVLSEKELLLPPALSQQLLMLVQRL